MSLDRTDLVTQKGSVSDVSGSDVSVSNLGDMEASLEAILENSDSVEESISSALSGSSQLSTVDDQNKQLLQDIRLALKILILHAEIITGEVLREKDTGEL